MSKTTADALEAAIREHLRDEDILEPEELLIDWCVVLAAIRPEHEDQTSYGWAAPPGVPFHHTYGLLLAATRRMDIATDMDSG